VTRPVVAVVTLAHGRHAHLQAQILARAGGTRVPDIWVAAAMDDELLEGVDRRQTSSSPPAARVEVVHLPRRHGHLPLAAARNAAAARAIDLGADVLVFLDVDCLPSEGLVERYAQACRSAAATPSGSPPPVVVSGAVHYLPPLAPGRTAYDPDDLRRSQPHPARPVAPEHDLVQEDDLRLFWSLSFGLSSAHWVELGGFDETYVGYGGEDTDFAMRLGRRGGCLYWLGGATAYHQYHDVEDPPRRHLADIVRNSNLFHDKWGEFPMGGWLDAFATEGLITLSGRPPRWSLTPGAGTPARTP
jgi:GT2 family glycosyltransferase